ncbi:hypothetical protein [Chryseobacterium sp. JUb7]|uniref:hypothetical protein n=1 Tax=Chryseobacterium sp. JUb7 TaxID=2940599 RepID=UPI0021680534|nr:hypothetical protein [Chryseobacterium sp. JUb7]MCS3529405.1 hypothetical protein [Chryseobacterium sp. JUb7]
MSIKIKQIDLFKDWVGLKKVELESKNFITDDLDDDMISILYFTLQNRIIPKKRRNIFKSNIFHCPDVLINNLSFLEEKIRNGEELLPHQSKRLENLEDKDGLLFDWNIFHLHLGTTLESDGFVQRTGPLLYCIFDDQNAYFIQILNHGQWTNQGLLKIIHENWPQTIKNFRICEGQNVTLTHNPSDSEINDFRKANINTLIKVDENVIYLGPGFGFTSSGHSAKAVQNHIRNKNALNDFQELLVKNTEQELLKLFGSLEVIKIKELELSMMNHQEGFKLVEKNNNLELFLKQ